jgi:hypothetical protein
MCTVHLSKANQMHIPDHASSFTVVLAGDWMPAQSTDRIIGVQNGMLASDSRREVRWQTVQLQDICIPTV